MFIAHALLKYFVFTLPGTFKFFESLGLPGALGYVTFAAELAGGALLVAGVRTRIVALALTPFVLRGHLGPLRKRLGLHGAKWRLGVPGVPDARRGGGRAPRQRDSAMKSAQAAQCRATRAQATTHRMKPLPTLFLSHGSPMHAVSPGVVGDAWAALGRRIARPERCSSLRRIGKRRCRC